MFCMITALPADKKLCQSKGTSYSSRCVSFFPGVMIIHLSFMHILNSTQYYYWKGLSLKEIKYPHTVKRKVVYFNKYG